MARVVRDDVSEENRERKRFWDFSALINRLRKRERLAKVGDFEEKVRFPEKGPRSAIESGRVSRTTRKSDPVVEKVVRARFEIDPSRESPKTGLRGRFRRDSKIENASRRRIIAVGTSNEAKRRPNRSKNDDFQKGPRGERSPVRPGDPFQKFGSAANGAERRKAKEELGHNDSMTSSTKMARTLFVVEKTCSACRLVSSLLSGRLLLREPDSRSKSRPDNQAHAVRAARITGWIRA